MSTETQSHGKTQAASRVDPFFYGWRMEPRWHANGTQTWEQVPLTEWDVLHPQEDDFIVQTDAHDRDCHYLKDVFEQVLANRPGTKVLHDHRIDWQVSGLIPHGPDLVAFENLNGPWDSERGTFYVREMDARPLLVVEVTSPSTKHIDFDEKVVEFHKAGVPLYIVVDRREYRGETHITIIGFRATSAGFVRILNGDPNGFWVEPFRIWMRPEEGFIACFDENGKRFENRLTLVQIADSEKARADAAEASAIAEAARAEAEAARAEAEAARAETEAARAAKLAVERDAEKAHARALEQKYKELEAEMRRLRGA